jgi:LmbE family N-acetylglucosaminyl deacetylase
LNHYYKIHAFEKGFFMNITLHGKTHIYIPDDVSLKTALRRATHIGIVAHSDDLEIMATHGILECYDQEDAFFLGIVLTNSAMSPCNDSSKSAAEIMTQRRIEQNKAAFLGNYSAVIIFDQTSQEIQTNKTSIVNDLITLVNQTHVTTAYIHNVFDRHPTHIAASIVSLDALRNCIHSSQIKFVYGCEVWGSLDWLPLPYKCALDVSKFPHISEALIKVFHSQINGGKLYDHAAIGRRISNATFANSHQKDVSKQVIYALNMLPLLRGKCTNLEQYMNDCLDCFRSEKLSNISYS